MRCVKSEWPRGRGASLFSMAVALSLLVMPSVASAKIVLVIGAHPDDEVLMAAGRSRTALLAGDTIKTAIVTNGDAEGGSREGTRDRVSRWRRRK